MLDIAVMVEGQDGVNWPRWQRLARTAEDFGFAGLYVSDHFTNADGPVLDSLELWTSLTWLAGHTERIEFGPLVSPISFRHPVVTAWTAISVDNLSGGRLRLGLGAGWQEREHNAFGFDLLDLDQRFARYQEGLEVITRLLRNDEPSSFEGEFYQLREALLLPRPERPGGPPIVIGGNGPKRTLPLAARYADEWNATTAPPSKLADLNAHLDSLLRERGRRPEDVRRTYMTSVFFGRDEAEVQRKLDGKAFEEQRARGVLVGTADQIVDQLQQVERAGMQRVMARWMDLDDIENVEAFANSVLPKTRG